MGREIRRVPGDWLHPQDDDGNFIPMLEYSPEYPQDAIEEYDLKFMPNWSEEEKTHYQMYENVTEGTPISPPMESPERLARWLTDNNANAGAGRTATYEQWLNVCKSGYAPSMLYILGVGVISGVEGSTHDTKDK